MSDTREGYGPALAAWIDSLRGNQSVRSFALEKGLDDARISAWRAGATPRLDQCRMVADALGVSLPEVLVAAGLAEPDEFVVVQAKEPPPPDIDVAIADDPRLTDVERDFLRTARATVHDVVSGKPAPARKSFKIKK